MHGGEPRAGEVPVRLDEPGDHSAALEVDGDVGVLQPICHVSVVADSSPQLCSLCSV